MGTVAVGLIGFGYAGSTLHAPLIQATDGMRLAAVASSDPSRVHEALGPDVEVLSPTDLIARSDIDVVVIAAPNDQHHPLTLSALAAGRHVVVDKPFALNALEAREMDEAARRAGRLLSVFHNRRWDGGYLTLRRLLREGTLGRPAEFIAHFDRYRPEVRRRWREGDGPGAGLWLDLGAHLIDQAVQLFGRPVAISLDTAQLRAGAVADDWFAATLRWADDTSGPLRARLHGSMLTAKPGPSLAVHGTRGSFFVDATDPQEAALKLPSSRAAIRSATWGWAEHEGVLWTVDDGALNRTSVPLDHGAYPAFYDGVRDAIRGHGPNPVAGDGALTVQEILDAGRRSARERREITL